MDQLTPERIERWERLPDECKPEGLGRNPDGVWVVPPRTVKSTGDVLRWGRNSVTSSVAAALIRDALVRWLFARGWVIGINCGDWLLTPSPNFPALESVRMYGDLLDALLAAAEAEVGNG
ncbi:MAG: hypothetical protein AAF432_00630 [Planctomycetota bacterium]